MSSFSDDYTMEDQNFLTYLQQNYPYLYDIEMSIRKIQASTQFGEVSFGIRVSAGVVDKGSVHSTEDKIYKRKVGNRFP